MTRYVLMLLALVLVAPVSAPSAPMPIRVRLETGLGDIDAERHSVRDIHGSDKRYTGHEICMASNETTVSIQDVTDKQKVKVLSHADYPMPGYTHQGWFTEDQRHWYLDDELDESGGLGRSVEGTRTIIFDVADLEQPVMVKEWIGTTKAIDHNQYVKGDRLYQSNYKAGLRILDISDPVNPKEVGYLDTFPGDNSAGFAGSWNNYPFFKNGAIGVVSIGEGFFMVRDATRKPVP